jgi:hypothetical protein
VATIHCTIFQMKSPVRSQKEPTSERADMRLPTIRAKTSGPDQERYRELLLSDYTRDSLSATLSLLWSVIGGSVPKKNDWWRALEFDENGKASRDEFDHHVIERIREFVSFFPTGPMPPMPTTFANGRPSRLAWYIQRAWTYLVLQSLAKIEGETGFFRDIQSILFLCAFHYLLPQLSTEGWHSERECLLNAMFMHTILVWRDDPAHQCFLQSLLADYLGQGDVRRDLLHRSFLLTPPTDNSYLTKAQEYWCDLVDAGQREQAMSFLLDLTRTARPDDVPEIKEMINDLVRLGRDATRAGAPKASPS